MGAMPVRCYKQMSTIKEGVIMRLQYTLSCTVCLVVTVAWLVVWLIGLDVVN